MAQCPSAWYSINITEIKFFTAAARHAGDIDGVQRYETGKKACRADISGGIFVENERF